MIKIKHNGKWKAVGNTRTPKHMKFGGLVNSYEELPESGLSDGLVYIRPDLDNAKLFNARGMRWDTLGNTRITTDTKLFESGMESGYEEHTLANKIINEALNTKLNLPFITDWFYTGEPTGESGDMWADQKAVEEVKVKDVRTKDPDGTEASVVNPETKIAELTNMATTEFTIQYVAPTKDSTDNKIHLVILDADIAHDAKKAGYIYVILE